MELSSFEVAVMVVTAFLALIAAATSVMTFWEKAKAIKKPHDDRLEELKAHGIKLDNDYEMIKETQEELRIVLRTELLVLEHIISGNHTDRLIEQRDFIQRYLIDK